MKFEIVIFSSIIIILSSFKIKNSINNNYTNQIQSETIFLEKEQKITDEEAKKIAVVKFEKYLPKILEEYDAVVDLEMPMLGDFTGDDIKDIAIFFSLAPKGGGNAIIKQGIALYQNTGEKVKVIAGFDPDYIFSFDTIQNGKIVITKLEYAEDDGRCCPSIKTPHQLTIIGNKAY